MPSDQWPIAKGLMALSPPAASVVPSLFHSPQISPPSLSSSSSHSQSLKRTLKNAKFKSSTREQCLGFQLVTENPKTSVMASINFGWFSDNWFQKPSNPISPLNLLLPITQTNLPNSSNVPNFALISGSNLFGRSKKPTKRPPSERTKRLFEQYIWECENLPDYRHAPEVEAILKEDEDSIFEKKENPTEEEIKENEKWWEEFSKSPVVQFLKRAEEIDDKINEMELKQNQLPYRKEDRELWKALPHVPGLDGRPMPRKSIKTDKQSDDKFWDFTKQFFFGLWGFKQRPYPTSRPIDVAQAIGYQRLEKIYYDFIMRSGGFWYKDRLGRSRGPSELIQLKTAWAGGIIDKDTFIWGDDMDEWAPIHMVYGLEKAIATWEVRLGASATAFYHKLTKGIPPWVPLKGHEKKTYKQLQEEAIESKKRDLAVMEANGGFWPGVKIPSHALFLWASGSELTTMLESDHMPNKYIPKDLRIQLAKAIPGLRPWEVLSVEQAMDRITYGGEWYRTPLGYFTTGPPYIQSWNRNLLRIYRVFSHLINPLVEELEEQMPGFAQVMQRVRRSEDERVAKRLQRIRAKQKREKEIAIYGQPLSDNK